MADQTPNICGDPASVQQLGDATGQTASELDKLNAAVNSDVKATVPDMYSGDAANALTRFTDWLLSKIPDGEGSPMDVYHKALAEAAKTMQQAKQLLAQAQQFRAQNRLILRPDLVVQACDPNQPDAAAAVAVGQNQVNAAKQIADKARQQIRDANQVLEKMAVQRADEISAVAGALGGKSRKSMPKKGPTMPKPRSNEESELLYGPEGRIRLPKDGTGTWSGPKGDSVWTPNVPGNVGLAPGQSIRFHDGVPDLSEYSPSMRPGGDQIQTIGGLELKGNLDRRWDNRQGDAALASQYGMTPDQVAQWRKDNNYVYHHYSDHELQVVPDRINRALTHQGGASEIP